MDPIETTLNGQPIEFDISDLKADGSRSCRFIYKNRTHELRISPDEIEEWSGEIGDAAQAWIENQALRVMADVDNEPAMMKQFERERVLFGIEQLAAKQTSAEKTTLADEICGLLGVELSPR